MRITVQAVVRDDDGTTNLPSVLGVIDRDRNSDPASGLGLFLREAHALLKALQAVVLAHQIDQFSRAARRCRDCGKQLARKDTKFLIYRTAYANPDFRVLGSIRAARTAARWLTVPEPSARWLERFPRGYIRNGSGCSAAMRASCRSSSREPSCGMRFRVVGRHAKLTP